MTTTTPAPRLACIALALALPLAAAADGPPASWDGLERRPSKTLDNVYVRPNVTFPAYKKVRLDPVSVEFDKSWDPNRGVKSPSNKLYKSDFDRIRSGLSDGFTKVLTDTLTKAGYPVVAEDDEEVLRVSASLVRVYINAPQRDSFGPRDTYVMDAGSVTLFMELRDAVTGQVLARVVDTAEGNKDGRMEWSTSGSNRAAAQQVFMGWAARLVGALDHVNGKGAR